MLYAMLGRADNFEKEYLKDYKRAERCEYHLDEQVFIQPNQDAKCRR